MFQPEYSTNVVQYLIYKFYGVIICKISKYSGIQTGFHQQVFETSIGKIKTWCTLGELVFADFADFGWKWESLFWLEILDGLTR